MSGGSEGSEPVCESRAYLEAVTSSSVRRHSRKTKNLMFTEGSGSHSGKLAHSQAHGSRQLHAGTHLATHFSLVKCASTTQSVSAPSLEFGSGSSVLQREKKNK